jgi:hypothetical protein
MFKLLTFEKQEKLMWVLASFFLALFLLFLFSRNVASSDFPKNNFASIVVLDGEVLETKYAGNPENLSLSDLGIDLKLQVGHEVYNVYLGPKVLEQNSGLNFYPGDEITVFGITIDRGEVTAKTVRLSEGGLKN